MTQELTAPLIPVADDVDSINELYATRRWSDGLPVVPPTPERVREMLRHTDRNPSDVVAIVPPGFGAATVERVAINAVLAGCQPSYMPVVVAAVEAMCDPRFNLQGIQVTTNPVAVMLLINGPAATQLEVNGSRNCLGQGWRANATIGRAVHLLMMNVGGCRPAEMDRATQGQPGKYTMCCAENEERTPWESLHVERGLPVTTSAVTVLAPAGTHNMNTHTKKADDLIRVVADTMVFPTSNDHVFGGEPIIMFGPEHAEILGKAGLSKAEVKRRLWEDSHVLGSRLAPKDLARLVIARREDIKTAIGPQLMIPISPTADEILILVAGGPGTHSVYMTSFGDARSVTKPITDAAGEPLAEFGKPVR